MKQGEGELKKEKKALTRENLYKQTEKPLGMKNCTQETTTWATLLHGMWEVAWGYRQENGVWSTYHKTRIVYRTDEEMKHDKKIEGLYT